SGADRFRLVAPQDYRVHMEVRECKAHNPPDAPSHVTAEPVMDEKHSHQWGHLHFEVPVSELPIGAYEVKYSSQPITVGDPDSFTHALPAMAAKIDTEALKVPTDGPPGSSVDVDFGGMNPLTKYWIAVRAADNCAHSGPYAVAELTTTRQNFTTLS